MTRQFMAATCLIFLLWGIPSRAAGERWAWLQDTSWYVPHQNLPAIEFDLATQELQVVTDQTVFYIAGYTDGYFWGKTVVQLTASPRLCLHMVGSVTPEGHLHLTFTANLPGVPPALTPKTTGIGNMRWLQGAWKMELQMTTGLNTLVTHWAYMTQCQEGEPCMQRLPGVQSSLQEFLEYCQE
jgi:hypothetical protein